ncbi:MAG: thioredoxin family protein [Planctomycetota bacterium]|nr:thioredoxin family protein [Planctomycetota bacterium]
MVMLTTGTRVSRCLLLGLVLLGGLVLASGLPSTASADDQVIHETMREFYRTGKYVMYVSGERQAEARIYHSRRAGAFLVLGSAYGKPLVIQPREKTVSELGADEVAERPDKGVDVVADATIASLGAVRLDKGGMAIDVEGLLARLQPQPYLLGVKNAEEVLLHSPEYERAGSSYRPRAADIKRIKASASEIEVIVYFGSWCPTCKRLLPRIIKVDEAIAGSNVKITYYGLPKGRAMSKDANVRRHRVKRIPTAVVLKDGKAVGQITSKGLGRPEAAILSALGK